MATGGNETAETIPLTTRELLAAILVFSEKDAFTERELVERVANVRFQRYGRHLSSSDRVRRCVSDLVISEVLRYDGASDRFIYDRRNEDHLRRILEPAAMSGLRRLVVNTAPRSLGIKTPVVLVMQDGEAR